MVPGMVQVPASFLDQSYSPLLPDRGSSLYPNNEEALKKWAQRGAGPYGSNTGNHRTIGWKTELQWEGSAGLRTQNREGVSRGTKHVKKSWRRLRTPGGAGEIGWSRTGRDETNKSPWPVFGSNNNLTICLNGADSCIVRRVKQET